MLLLAWSPCRPNVEKSIENVLNSSKGGRPKKQELPPAPRLAALRPEAPSGRFRPRGFDPLPRDVSAKEKTPQQERLRKSSGGWGGSRTPDTGIFSPLLYQLSYPAECVSE